MEKNLDEFIEEFKKNKFTKNADSLPNIFRIFGNSYSKSASNPNNYNNQVLIKTISNLSAKSVTNAINYIINNSSLGYAINENNMQVRAKDILDDWERDFSYKTNSKEAWHLVFSLNDNKANIEQIFKAVNDTMIANFIDYKYILVPHIHQNNPHIHVIINKNNKYTNKKLHFKTKEDIKSFFYQLREDFTNNVNYYYKHNNIKRVFKNEDKIDSINLQNDISKEINIAILQNDMYNNINSYLSKIGYRERKIKEVQEKIDLIQIEIKDLKTFITNANINNNINEELFTKIKELKEKSKKYYKYLKRIKALHKKKRNLESAIDKSKFFIKNTQSLSLINRINYYKEYLEYSKTNLTKKDCNNYKYILSNTSYINSIGSLYIKNVLILPKINKRKVVQQISSLRQINKAINFLNKNNLYDGKTQKDVIDKLNNAQLEIQNNLKKYSKELITNIEKLKDDNVENIDKKLKYYNFELHRLKSYGLVDNSTFSRKIETIKNIENFKIKK